MGAEPGPDVPHGSAPTSLSKRDRLQLALLHRMASSVTDDSGEAEYHSKMIEVLEHGFTAEYSAEFTPIYDELPLEECRLVTEILEMFRVLGASVEAIGSDAVRQIDEHAARALQFAGFDFNDSREGRMADYAEYLIRQGRWVELAVFFDDDHERGNSHMPTLDAYVRMLAVYRPIWEAMTQGAVRDRYLLGNDELSQVVRARPYPR